MTEPGDLDGLLADTEAQLDAALAAARAGSLLDMADLVPRLERVCALAVAQRARDLAARLAGLVDRLNAIETVLRERLVEPAPDPVRAAALYRAAAPPADEEPG